MKKLVLLAIGLSLLIATPAFAFTDVTEDHPNYTAITYLEDKGVLGGYLDGSFKPDNPINRVEILKILILGNNIEPNDMYEPADFSDTAAGQWYAPFLAESVGLGVVSGYPDGTYKPLQTVNKAEALKMILKLDLIIKDALHNLKIHTEGPYNDVSADQWFNEYFWDARNLNLVGPDQEGNVNPGKNLTRGELAELMYRMAWLNEKNEMQELFDLPLLRSYRTEVELNNLDVDNGSDKMDFDAGLDGISFPSSDIWLGSLAINGYWTRDVDWWVIDMTKLPEYEGMEMTEVFDRIRECPLEGYATVDDDDGDGFGSPRTPYSGGVFCMRSNEFNYAKVEVIDVYSENFGDDKFLKFRYIFRPDANLELP